MQCKVTHDGWVYKTASTRRYVLFCRYDEREPVIVRRSDAYGKLNDLRHKYPRSVIVDTVAKAIV
jgi:hypothetical protein